MTDARISSPILELLEIIEDWHDCSYVGKRNLKKEILNWTDRWVVLSKVDMDIANPKMLTTENEDLIKYRLGEMISEQLTEECLLFDLKKHKLSATIISMRRKAND